MDCFFHAHVPSVAACTECGKAICATCRDPQGACPSCRLAQKIDAASGVRERLPGAVRTGPQASPPPFVQVRAQVALLDDPVESRALVALGYPLWPLALLALFDRKQSTQLRKQTFQALGFNLGFAAFGGLLAVIASIPWLGISAGILLPFLIPLFIIGSLFFAIKVWHGEDVRVPIISDWIDERRQIT